MTAVTLIRWIAAGLAAAAALWLSTLNWLTLIRRIRMRTSPSWIPLLGGILGCGAMVLEPSGLLAPYCWVPLILDGGSLPGLLFTLVWYLRRRR